MDVLNPRESNPLRPEKFRYMLILFSGLRFARISSFSILIPRFHKSILRFDSRTHSDDNYAYVTPVEG
jgi:hypothetical protein